ncbi:MAG TPA: hypothetical protein VHK69_00890 [Chitinophagaceae bacterium]|nr:hypothetical protein [Chitinophagaceae bacterium]
MKGKWVWFAGLPFAGWGRFLGNILLFKMQIKKIGILLLWILQAGWSWYCFYRAQFYPYDENYGLLIGGFLLSVAGLVAAVVYGWQKPRGLKGLGLPFILWLLLGSPVTFLLAALYYEVLFSACLSTG